LRRIVRRQLLAGVRERPAVDAERDSLWRPTHRVVRFCIHRASPTLCYFASYDFEKQVVC
jgi:hypothetical protein